MTKEEKTILIDEWEKAKRMVSWVQGLYQDEDERNDAFHRWIEHLVALETLADRLGVELPSLKK